MPAFDATIEVTHRAGILDPAGATVERSLPALGWDNVSRVSIGKSIRLRIDAENADAARNQLDEMCQKLLANPVIEDFSVEVAEATAP